MLWAHPGDSSFHWQRASGPWRWEGLGAMTRYLHLELRMNSPVELPVNGAEHVFHIFCENLCWLPKNWNINGNTWRVSELVANTDNSNNFFKSPAKAKFYKDNSFSLQYPEHYSSTLYWLTSADAERTKKKKKKKRWWVNHRSQQRQLRRSRRACENRWGGGGAKGGNKAQGASAPSAGAYPAERPA